MREIADLNFDEVSYNESTIYNLSHDNVNRWKSNRRFSYK